MAFYLRKSVKIGPVRFNLSKSGIGTSVGVTGFRVGVRPNGSRYLHAGRHGLYYREELGNPRAKRKEYTENEIELVEKYSEDTIKHNIVSNSLLEHSSKKELILSLNKSYKSYKSFRLDYLIGIVSILTLFFLWEKGTLIRYIISFVGLLATIFTTWWEIKRRTINIVYDFKNDSSNFFKGVISAFNQLADNHKVWSLIDTRNLFNSHESKLNSGASSLINRTIVKIGEGPPPWVKTNLKIPLIKTHTRSLYFMPDGILVYDKNSVGFVEYDKLKISFETTRFIEEHLPRDAKIVDYTWKYPNKNGEPDRRFNNNYEIPICLYGELKIKTGKGLLLYIQTSKYNTPEKFYKNMSSIIP